jgi:hypothetical protein
MPSLGPAIPIWDVWWTTDKAPMLAMGPELPPKFNFLHCPSGPPVIRGGRPIRRAGRLLRTPCQALGVCHRQVNLESCHDSPRLEQIRSRESPRRLFPGPERQTAPGIVDQGWRKSSSRQSPRGNVPPRPGLAGFSGLNSRQSLACGDNHCTIAHTLSQVLAQPANLTSHNLGLRACTNLNRNPGCWADYCSTSDRVPCPTKCHAGQAQWKALLKQN